MSQNKVVSLSEARSKLDADRDVVIHDAIDKFKEECELDGYAQVLLIGVTASGDAFYHQAGKLKLSEAVFALEAVKFSLFSSDSSVS
jgi:uridine phosphorylase